MTGTAQPAMRALFVESRTAAELRQMAQGIANALLPGATGDSLTAFDGRDLEVVPRIAFVVRQDHALTQSGDRGILTLPLPELAGSGVAAALAADEGRRRFPIDVAKVFGPRTVTYELRLTLPEGWRAELPPPVTAVSAFGTYEARYSQEGRELRAVRRLQGATGIEPPYRIADLIIWLQKREKDDVRYVVLRHP